MSCTARLRAGGLFAAAPRSESVRPRVDQLSQARHKVQLTVSSETREKLERARDLMKHRNPSGELEVVFDRAMDALLEKLEKERLAKTAARRRRYVRRNRVASRQRCGARSSRAMANNARTSTRRALGCGCTSLLELDHKVPRARGGADDASNLRVACRAHNQMAAELAFGKGYVASRIEGAKAARRDAARAQARKHGATPDPEVHDQGQAPRPCNR